MNQREEEPKQMEELKEYDMGRQINTNVIKQSNTIQFDWDNKWLKGDEYYHILTNAELYIKIFNFGKYPMKTHPSTTYSNPTSNSYAIPLDGTIYFVEGLSVGSDFGFPRIHIKKQYKW